jgi:hypothetical protein
LGDEAFSRKLAQYQRAVEGALRVEYREIFLITAGVCLVAAGACMALGRGARVEERVGATAA